MMLALIASLTVALAGFLFYRDRKRLRARHRDLASEDLKRFLNLPSPNDAFPDEVNQTKTVKRPSRRLLEEFNETKDNE